jgi:hypothetical protein
MTTVVIMPGGFHPFHAGHLALYQSAQRAFPDAEVFVAATNDTSARPFPFAVKEKLAKLAGVDAGHFVQVKSPFRAEEITSHFDPATDTLIFVRSEKDATKPPQAGGIKKDGNPAYLQPLLGATRLEPFAKHAYMAYLPTVEFGPGMTSATEIRGAWPQLDDKRKTALVMSLYPATQTNPKLAATVVKLLDTAMGGENQPVAETNLDSELAQKKQWTKRHYANYANDEEQAFDKWVQRSLKHSEEEDQQQDRILKRLNKKIEILAKQFTQLTKIKQPMERIQENVRDTRIDFVEEKNR